MAGGAAVAVLTARAMWGAAGVAAGVIAVVVTGLVSLRLNPRVACPSCRGASRFYSWLTPWRFRMCSHCGGNGRVLHPAVRVLGSAPQKQEYAQSAEARRGHHRWTQR